MKKSILMRIFSLLAVFFLLAGCTAKTKTETTSPEAVSETSFVDDDGNPISVEQPYHKIISLYSAHTENLYTLGAGDSLIGTHKTAIYPPEAAQLPRFDYRADPEAIIAAEPDLVLIRPFISRKAPEFIDTLKSAGIPVVSLYPDTYDEFDDYIKKLALLTGTEETAKKELEKFHSEISSIQKITESIPEKQSIFFEATDADLCTTTPDSMAGTAITLAGGINIANDAKPMTQGSSIASFGEEKILAHANDIDVYVSQRGAMNAGGNERTILSRPGFETIQAVKDNRVYVINEKIISSPTFRYSQGIRELARYLYPDTLDKLTEYENDKLATKTDLAHILVNLKHIPMYVPSSSKYYESNHQGHVYGMFSDVSWKDKDFNAIETATICGALPWEEKDGAQVFSKDAPATKEMLAKIIFVLYDLDRKDQPTAIADLSEVENENIVQCIVDHEILPLTDGKFEPQKQMTNTEIISAFQQAEQLSK